VAQETGIEQGRMQPKSPNSKNKRYTEPGIRNSVYKSHCSITFRKKKDW